MDYQSGSSSASASSHPSGSLAPNSAADLSRGTSGPARASNLLNAARVRYVEFKEKTGNLGMYGLDAGIEMFGCTVELLIYYGLCIICGVALFYNALLPCSFY